VSKIPVEEYRRSIKPKAKYGNKKVVVNGKKLDSKFESEIYLQLLVLRKCKKISKLRLQPSYQIHPAFTDRFGKKHRAIYYRGDFEFVENGRTVAVDAKGFKTAVFKLKEKLFRFCYPEIELRIIKK
jgi:hypothetical protein